MAIDIIARGMIEDSNGNISQLSEKVSNHTDNSDIHVTVSDKENWNSHPNDVMASGNPVQIDGLQGGVPFSEISVSGDDIIGQELTVNVSGKNLMKYPYYNTTQTQNGVTFTDNGDGSITVNGTATATAYFSLSSNNALPTGKYVLGKSMDNILLYVDKYLDNAFYQRLATSTETIKELIFNVSEEDAQKYTYKFGMQINKGNTEDNVTIYPQLELGDSATPYEPYHGAEYTITPTSNPYVIPNDIRQVDGRNVVSVSAGELSVTGVRKNAAIKRIWDDMGMDLLFDGVTAADNPALIDIKDYSIIVVSVASKYSDDIINTGTIIMAVSDIIKSISVGIKRYFSTGSRASIINITGTINNCAIVLEPYNTGDTILNCKIYGNK